MKIKPNMNGMVFYEKIEISQNLVFGTLALFQISLFF